MDGNAGTRAKTTFRSHCCSGLSRTGGRDGRRLDGRPDGSKDPADDFHSLVLALQLHRRFWIRFYVNEPAVWVENRRQQRETKTEVNAPLLSIFKRGLLFNTLTACFWIASTFCVYYSIWALFSAYLQKELNWTPLMVATPLFWANIVVFAGNSLRGFV